MSVSRTLLDIAKTLQTDAEFIERFIEERRKQTDGKVDFAFSGGSEVGLPPHLESKRQSLLDAVEEFTFLLRGPTGHVLYKSNPVNYSVSFIVQAIERFQVATKLGPDETISFTELARRCRLDRQDLTHLMRAAIAHRIFEGSGESNVRHSAASLAIAKSDDLRHWIRLVREDLLPAHRGLIEAFTKYPGAREPNESGWSLSHNTNMTIFESAQKDHELAARFAGSMRLLAKGSLAELPRVAAALGLEKMQGTIVDVGGSTGSLMFEILRVAPMLMGVVQDLPEVVERAETPVDLRERLTFQPSNFFEEQRETGADIYLFRKIFHDWSDARCINIINQTIPALKVGAQVMINELCLPRPGEIPPRREQEQRGWDLTMKALTNGLERSKEEWIALFQGVDERFHFEGIRMVSGASSHIIIFSWGKDTGMSMSDD